MNSDEIAKEIVSGYVEQIRPFTDRIAQLEASNEKLREVINQALGSKFKYIISPRLRKVFKKALEE